MLHNTKSPPRELIITGSVAIDRIMAYPGHFSQVIKPEHMRQLSVSMLVDAHHTQYGGVAANIAYTLALLGESAILLGAVGNDAESYIATLTQLGVNTRHVHRSPLPTATFTVFTDQNACQIGAFYPGAMSDAQALSLVTLATPQSFVMISPHDPAQMLVQVQECIAQHIPYAFDPGQQCAFFDRAALELGCFSAQLVFVNEYELHLVEEKLQCSLDTLLTHIPTLVVTRGAQGSDVYVNATRHHVGVVQPTPVVDPTGAGDAYRAGFLYGLMRGADVVVCAQLGATAAAYVVEQRGGQQHRFTVEEFQRRFKKTFGEFPTVR
jgi:adenosine kinase